MMELIKKLFHKYRELIVYVFFGGVTTLVNFSAYFVLKNVFMVYYVITNVLAWAISAIFAFVVNKIFVFESTGTTIMETCRELVSFLGLRALSGGLETLLLWVFVEFAGMNDDIVKIVVAVLVVVTNYIFSKLIIFRKNGKNKSVGKDERMK